MDLSLAGISYGNTFRILTTLTGHPSLLVRAGCRSGRRGGWRISAELLEARIQTYQSQLMSLHRWREQNAAPNTDQLASVRRARPTVTACARDRRSLPPALSTGSASWGVPNILHDALHDGLDDLVQCLGVRGATFPVGEEQM